MNISFFLRRAARHSQVEERYVGRPINLQMGVLVTGVQKVPLRKLLKSRVKSRKEILDSPP